MLKKASTTVTFIFNPNHHEYSQVSLAGQFNQWSTTAAPMKREKDGTYQATLQLEPGEHQFRYCADGEWLNDPEADGEVPNGFGSNNSIVRVIKAPEPAKPGDPPKPTIRIAPAPEPRHAPAPESAKLRRAPSPGDSHRAAQA